MPESPFDIGDVVHDRDDDDPSDAIVVNTPDVPAEDWNIPRIESTLAEDNPDYPEDAPTVVIVYEDDLDTYIPEWDRENPLPITQLNDVGVYHYSFPAPRLKHVEHATTESAESETEIEAPTETPVDAEPSAAVRELKDRLENGGMTTEIESDGRTICATKLGDTYRVRPGEIVDGDGVLRNRLEAIVTAPEIQAASSE